MNLYQFSGYNERTIDQLNIFKGTIVFYYNNGPKKVFDDIIYDVTEEMHKLQRKYCLI